MVKQEKKVVMQKLSDEELEQAAGGQLLHKTGLSETCLSDVDSAGRGCNRYTMD